MLITHDLIKYKLVRNILTITILFTFAFLLFLIASESKFFWIPYALGVAASIRVLFGFGISKELIKIKFVFLCMWFVAINLVGNLYLGGIMLIAPLLGWKTPEYLTPKNKGSTSTSYIEPSYTPPKNLEPETISYTDSEGGGEFSAADISLEIKNKVPHTEEEKVIELTKQLFRAHNKGSLEEFETLFSPIVRFYGFKMGTAEILKLKKERYRRWPIRSLELERPIMVEKTSEDSYLATFYAIKMRKNADNYQQAFVVFGSVQFVRSLSPSEYQEFDVTEYQEEVYYEEELFENIEHASLVAGEALSEEGLERFLQFLAQYENTGDLESYAKAFTKPATYFGSSRTPQEILEDSRSYREKWPHFHLERISPLRFTEFNPLSAKFSYQANFSAANPEKSQQGKTDNTLTVELQNGMMRIASLSGNVTEKKETLK